MNDYATDWLTADAPEWARQYEPGDTIRAEVDGEVYEFTVVGWSTQTEPRDVSGLPVVSSHVVEAKTGFSRPYGGALSVVEEDSIVGGPP